MYSDCDSIYQEQHTKYRLAWSLLLGLALTVLPLPHAVYWLRPEWVLLILLYWSLSEAVFFGVGVAFIIGLYVDLLVGTVFGLHAFLYIIFVFLSVNSRKIVSVLPAWQQMLLIWAVTFFLLMLEGFVFHKLELHFSMWAALTRAFITALCWPWVVMLLTPGKKK